MPLTGRLLLDDRAPRYDLDLPGTMRRGDRVPIDVAIENLSTSGFLMRTDVALRLGDTVSVGIAGIGRRAAVVVRRTEAGFGCMMLTPIAEEMVAAAEVLATLSVTQLPGATGGRRDDAIDRAPLPIRLRVIGGAILLSWGVAVTLLWTLLI